MPYEVIDILPFCSAGKSNWGRRRRQILSFFSSVAAAAVRESTTFDKL